MYVDILWRTLTDPPGLPAKPSALSVAPPLIVTNPRSISPAFPVDVVPLATAVVMPCALFVPSVAPVEEHPESSIIAKRIVVAAPEIATVTVLAAAAQLGNEKI